ncbi:MAG: hypothetical protein JST39_11825, partial [Bacteroidetes bacterium]|nr:hypothetical protein [Bacteroidota bacterium]
MSPDYGLLSDPFLNALRTEQKYLALGTGHIVKFPADVLPFMGLENYDRRFLPEIASFLLRGEEVFVKDCFDSLPDSWALLSQVPVIQMICRQQPVQSTSESEIV